MLGQQNGPQLLHRPVHRVVDDKVVEVAGHGELLLAPLQAAADLLHILGAPADEPALSKGRLVFPREREVDLSILSIVPQWGYRSLPS